MGDAEQRDASASCSSARELGPIEPEDRLAKTRAIVHALSRTKLPDGPVALDAGLASALELPISILAEKVVKHSERCRLPTCHEVPASLLTFRHMRPAAIRSATDQLLRALWSEGDHRMVASVRKEVAAKYEEAARAVGDQTIFEPARLAELLSKFGPESVRILCAVLWASGLGDSRRDVLFRMLVPFASVRERKGKAQAGRSAPEMEALNARVRKLEKALKRANRATEDAKKALQPQERTVKRLRDDLSLAVQREKGLLEQLEALAGHAAKLGSDREASDEDVKKLTRVIQQLRSDLKNANRDLRDVRLDRSDLAIELASVRQELERLRLRLRLVPRGVDAVFRFLVSEGKRIKIERTIRFGGLKTRAEEEWKRYRKLKRAFLDAFPAYRERPPMLQRPKTPARLVALGGSGEVGRSSYLVELGKHRILVDCGIKPNGSKEEHPDISGIDRLDAIVLTHAHTDHIGWVPALVRRFPRVPIYCTPGTAALLPIMLGDCLRHYVRRLAHEQAQAPFLPGIDGSPQEYDEGDVRLVSNLVLTCVSKEEERLPFGDASLTFYPAGHILGAASVLLKDNSGRAIFLSGDFSSFEQLTLPAADWPADLPDLDLLVLESTYGNRDHRPLQEARTELVSHIRTVTINDQGSVIIACFALGRAQEVLTVLSNAQKAGELPAELPIYVDGLIREINPVYRRFAEFLIPEQSYIEVGGEADRRDVVFNAAMRPCVVVTTSGMLNGGPVVAYASRLLPDPRHSIILTGYQDEGAPSRALIELIGGTRSSRVVRIPDEDGKVIEFTAARAAKEVRLSSHADRSGLVAYAARLRPATIALVHGDEAAQSELRSRLQVVHPKAEIVCGPAAVEVP